MPDPAREVTIEKDGRRYTLYIGNRALRLIEEKTGRPAARLEEMSVNDLTIVVWAALQRHHPGMGLDDVDEIIDLFGYQAIGEALAGALSAAFRTSGGQGNPPMAGGLSA